MDKHTLFLDFPAGEWELASPVGNGASGAMIWGGVSCERIQLSHEAIWSGGKIDACYDGFRERIDVLRELLLAGKGAEADEYSNTEFAAAFHRVKSNETAGDLLIEFGGTEDCEDYRRELDLVNGVSTVTFQKEGASVKRETFASYPDRVIVSRHSGTHSAKLRFVRPNVGMNVIPSTEELLEKLEKPLTESYYDPWGKVTREGSELFAGIRSVTVDGAVMTVRAETLYGGHEYFVKIRVDTDGVLTTDGVCMFIENASRTDYTIVIGVGNEPEFPAFDYETLLMRAKADFSAIMARSDISLGDGTLDDMPVNKRLARLAEDPDAHDAGLSALYFTFGKYLLAASSRPGTLPAHLQGVWNGYTYAPWNADYHTNINLQMNYWHAEAANISECALPLFDYMNGYLLESGRETALVNYRCRGTVLHHLSDIYGFTAPADGVWGLWPLGAAWLCYSMWEHYLYTGDLAYLRDTAYEYIRDSARFFLDYMIEVDGVLLSGPSTSPENHYLQNGKSVSRCMSPSMDIEIIGGLLRFYIKTEELLGINPAWADEARAALSKMPPLKIGKHGQLMEWMEDYDEPEPGHRHISHLFALYPDCSISQDTPELFAAAKKSLERRLAHGGGHTGWSCAWLAALYARLGDSDGVSATLRKLYTKSTRPSLLDSHPPFQIDGNFGASAAIIESLMQSHNGKLVLLPACPPEFASGSFTRLMARGNGTPAAEISAKWSDGVVSEVVIAAVRGDYRTKLHINGKIYDISLKKGECITL